MKMRKILSFVLVLSLVLGSFSMAFAATPATTGLSDIAGIANEDAIQVNNDLGIITGFPDGTFLPEKAVTRAEFAAMITRALAVPESALAGYTSTTFKDTAGYGWAVPYLAFAQSKGIMIGDGMGNVMPGRTINVNEAMTMVLRAVGYVNHSAELVGTWPSNYVTVAQNVGLYDDVAATLTVDRANAAQIIYNALTVQKVSVNADGETKYLTLSGTTTPAVLLNTGLDCKAVTGKVLGDTSYSYDDALFNIVANLGAYGDAYVNSDDEVVAFTKKSVALTGEIDGDKFKANGVKYDFVAPLTKASDAAVTIVNGASPGADDIATVAASSQDGKVTINVELSGKNIKSLYSIVAWGGPVNEKATSADVAGIADGELLTVDFDLDDDDNIVGDSFQLIGVKSLSDIKADNVVYVYGDPIRKVAVGTDTVTGKVTEKGSDYIVVAGTEYKFYKDSNDKPSGAATISAIKAGDEVELTLDAFKYVYEYDSTSKADTFGVMQGIDIVAPGGIDDSRIKLYTSAGSSKTFTLESGTDLTVNGTAGGALPWAGKSITTSAIVKYGLNSDGVINNVQTNKYAVATTAAMKSASVISIGSSAQSFPVASDAVVFTWNGSEYNTSTVANLALNTELSYSTAAGVDYNFAYVTDTDGYVVAMVVKSTSASKDSDDLYAVVTKTTETVDADNNTVQRVQGFANGAAFDKKTTRNTSYAKVTTLGATNVIKFTLDADGNIKSDAAALATAGTYATSISAINSARDAINLGGTWYALAKDVNVYEIVTTASGSIDTYKVSSVSALRASADYRAVVYDMDQSTDNEGYEVVVFVKL